MRQYFNIDRPGEYLDELAILKREIRIDIFKFDDWLHEQIGEYEENDKISMNQALVKHYGQEASNFIKNLI